MANFKISELDSILGNTDRAVDMIPIVDVSDNETKQGTVNQILGITGNPVGHTDTQTLTNKTITAPNISDAVLSGTVTGTYTLGGTPTFPAAVVTLTGSQTLTNKVLTSPTINTATISNPTLTVNTVSEFTAANGVTVDGLNIKDGKLNTADSVVTSNYTDGSILPEHLVTGAGTSWVWQSYTATLTNLSGGTQTSRYCQIGKTVFYRFGYVLAGAGVAGNVTFTLPVTSVSYSGTAGTQVVGIGRILDSGTGSFECRAVWASTTTATIAVYNASATYLSSTALTNLIPMTWAVSDEIYITGSYEAA